MIRIIRAIAIMVALFCVAPVLAQSAPGNVKRLTGQVEGYDSWQGPAGAVPYELLQENLLLEALKDKFRVEIASDSDALDDEGLLVYLYAYFSAMDPQLGINIVLHQTKDSGPIRVRREDREGVIHLYFTKDAAYNVITESFRKALKEIHNAKPNSPVTNITLSFNNTLFEQLTVGLQPFRRLKAILLTEYGISITAPDTANDIGKFTTEELAHILKQLTDNPISIIHKMKLVKLTRMVHGYIFEPDGEHEIITAKYDPETLEILLTDEAFENHQIPSEGENSLALDKGFSIEESFIHELGHALWSGMSKEEKDRYAKITPKTDSDLFVSGLGMENLEEDFAEHFRCFFNNRGLLDDMAGPKRDYFKSLLFFDTDYYRSAHPNATIYVDTDGADMEPPALSKPLRELLKIHPYQSEQGRWEISLRLEGVIEEGTGVERIRIWMKGKQTKHTFPFIIRQYDYDEQMNTYAKTLVFIRGIFWKPDGLGMGTTIFEDDYIVEKVDLRDYAQKERRIKIGEAGYPLTWLPGKKMKTKRTRDGVLLEDYLEAHQLEISISPYTHASGQEIHRISLPIPHVKGLESINTDLRGSNGRQYRVMVKHFQSDPGNDAIVFDVQVNNHLNEDHLHLNSLDFRIAETAEFAKEQFRAELSYGNHPNLTFPIHPTQPDLSTIDIGINKMVKPEAFKTSKPNVNKGNRTIHAFIPADEVKDQQEELKMEAQFLSPGGSEFRGGTSNEQGTQVIREGRSYYVLPIHLPPGNEDGDYIFDKVKFRKLYPMNADIEGVNNMKAEAFQAIPISERDIKRRFRVRIVAD